MYHEQMVMERVSPVVAGRVFGEAERSRSLSSECLWVVVAAVFVCDALAVALNTDLRLSADPGVSRSARLAAQEAGRVYNWVSIGMCLACLVVAIGRGGAFGRVLRALKGPVLWAALYQVIIAYHYVADDNLWDLARTCGEWGLVMVAMSASPLIDHGRYVQKMRSLFRLLVWMSVVAGVLLPNNVWHRDYDESFIPGISVRFAGVGGQANGMGALAGVAVLLELHHLLGSGSRRRWLGFLNLVLSSAVLLLTQSKTSIVACAVCAVYLLLTGGSRVLSRALRALTVGVAVLAGGLSAWAVVSDWVALNRDSLADLTGRLPLWRYYWELGLDRPWLGYGRSLWLQLNDSPSFQFKWAAGNAHNQILNSLLMAGAAGVCCLVIYVASLFRSRWRVDAGYRGLYTACLLFMVIRSLSEAGFEPGDMSVVASLQMFVIGFCFCRRATRSCASPGVPYGVLDARGPGLSKATRQRVAVRLDRIPARG